MPRGKRHGPPAPGKQKAKGTDGLQVVSPDNEAERAVVAESLAQAQQEEAHEREENGHDAAAAHEEMDKVNGRTIHRPSAPPRIQDGTVEYNANFLRVFLAWEELNELNRKYGNKAREARNSITSLIREQSLKLGGSLLERLKDHKIMQEEGGEQKLRERTLNMAYVFQLAGRPVGSNADFFPEDRRPAAEIAAHEGKMHALTNKPFDPYKWGNTGDEAHDAYVIQYNAGKEILLQMAADNIKEAKARAEEPPPFDDDRDPDEPVH